MKRDLHFVAGYASCVHQQFGGWLNFEEFVRTDNLEMDEVRTTHIGRDRDTEQVYIWVTSKVGKRKERTVAGTECPSKDGWRYKQLNITAHNIGNMAFHVYLTHNENSTPTFVPYLQ